MAHISPDETRKIANLAKLELDEKEIDKYSKHLSNVLRYIEELSEVDIKNTEPTSQTTGLTNVLRDDVIDETYCIPQDRQFEVEQILKK